MKKGISLVSLMVTIVILIILISTVTISTSASINESRKITFALEISFIQEEVNRYYAQNGELPILSEINLQIDEKEKEQFLEEENQAEIKLYTIDFSKLSKLETVYETSKYAVSKISNNVYYIDGVTLGEKTYYTLTEDLKSIIRYSNDSLHDGIIFMKSENGWTNELISSEILIPSKLENVKVSVKQDGQEILQVTDNTEQDGYNRYIVNQVSGNYNIEVEYIKEKKSKKEEFLITNFDNDIPSFNVSEIKTYDTYHYLELFDIMDEKSGISKIKYETHMVADEEMEVYFSKKGKILEENTIEIGEEVGYITIYVEDNAGNYAYKIIEVKK